MRTALEELAGRAHFDKYERLAQWLGVDALRALVPFSKEGIELALSNGDEHLNSLPLATWDAKHGKERAKPTACRCCNQTLPSPDYSSGVLGLWRAARLRHTGTGIAPLVNQGWSLSDTVCTLKHVARHHIAGVPRP